ncbi:MAG: hypothetical protein H6631_06040 [Anaerolineaceae bacterium]|nr:hypothetical protein [Anaerolineaceae bacterium]
MSIAPKPEILPQARQPATDLEAATTANNIMASLTTKKPFTIKYSPTLAR